MTTTKRREHFMEFLFASASAINYKNSIAQNQLYTKCKLKENSEQSIITLEEQMQNYLLSLKTLTYFCSKSLRASIAFRFLLLRSWNWKTIRTSEVCKLMHIKLMAHIKILAVQAQEIWSTIKTTIKPYLHCFLISKSPLHSCGWRPPPRSLTVTLSV